MESTSLSSFCSTNLFGFFFGINGWNMESSILCKSLPMLMDFCLGDLGRKCSDKYDLRHFYSDLEKTWSSNAFSDPILRFIVKVCITIFKYFDFCSTQDHCDGDFGGKQENSLNITRSWSIFDSSNINIDDHHGWLPRISWVWNKNFPLRWLQWKMIENFLGSRRVLSALLFSVECRNRDDPWNVV